MAKISLTDDSLYTFKTSKLALTTNWNIYGRWKQFLDETYFDRTSRDTAKASLATNMYYMLGGVNNPNIQNTADLYTEAKNTFAGANMFKLSNYTMDDPLSSEPLGAVGEPIMTGDQEIIVKANAMNARLTTVKLSCFTSAFTEHFFSAFQYIYMPLTIEILALNEAQLSQVDSGILPRWNPNQPRDYNPEDPSQAQEIVYNSWISMGTDENKTGKVTGQIYSLKNLSRQSKVSIGTATADPVEITFTGFSVPIILPSKL
jgi:hypothetical protein